MIAAQRSQCLRGETCGLAAENEAMKQIYDRNDRDCGNYWAEYQIVGQTGSPSPGKPAIARRPRLEECVRQAM